MSQAIFGTAPDFHVGKLADVGARGQADCFFVWRHRGRRTRCFTARRCSGSCHWRKASTGVSSASMRRSLERWSARWRGCAGTSSAAAAIAQNTLLGTQPFAALLFVFFFRFGFGAVPRHRDAGGIFTPMLILGAQLGLIYGRICQFIFPGLELQPVGFAVVGIAAFFTGVVRAPLTGIVLATEMTANVDLLLPMLGACFAAMLAPSLLRSAPIYDLRELALRQRIEAPIESVSAWPLRAGQGAAAEAPLRETFAVVRRCRSFGIASKGGELIFCRRSHARRLIPPSRVGFRLNPSKTGLSQKAFGVAAPRRRLREARRRANGRVSFTLSGWSRP